MKKLITILGTVSVLGSTALATSCSSFLLFNLDNSEQKRIQNEIKGYAELSSFAARGNILGDIANLNTNTINNYYSSLTAKDVFGKDLLTQIKGSQFNVESSDDISKISEQVFGTTDLTSVLKTNESGNNNVKMNTSGTTTDDSIGTIVSLIPTILNLVLGQNTSGYFDPSYISGIINMIPDLLKSEGVDLSSLSQTADSMDKIFGITNLIDIPDTLSSLLNAVINDYIFGSDKSAGKTIDSLLGLVALFSSKLPEYLNSKEKIEALIKNYIGYDVEKSKNGDYYTGDQTIGEAFTTRLNSIMNDDGTNKVGSYIDIFRMVKSILSYINQFYSVPGAIDNISNIYDSNHLFSNSLTNNEVISNVVNTPMLQSQEKDAKGNITSEKYLDNTLSLNSFNNLISDLTADSKTDRNHYGIQRAMVILFSSGANGVENPISQTLIGTIIEKLVNEKVTDEKTKAIIEKVLPFVKQVLPLIFSSLTNRDSELNPTIANIINIVLTLLKTITNSSNSIVGKLIDFLEWTITPGKDHIMDLYNGNILGDLLGIDGINNLKDLLENPLSIILDAVKVDSSSLPIAFYDINDSSLKDILNIFTKASSAKESSIDLTNITKIIDGVLMTVHLKDGSGKAVQTAAISGILRGISDSSYSIDTDKEKNTGDENVLSYSLGMTKNNTAYAEGSLFDGLACLFGNGSTPSDAETNGIEHIVNLLTNLATFVKESEQSYWNDTFASWVKPENWSINVLSSENYLDAYKDAIIKYSITFKNDSKSIGATKYNITLTRYAWDIDNPEYSSNPWTITSIEK